MSTMTDPRDIARIIAYDARKTGTMKTVNIVTSAPRDKHNAKEHIQYTAAQVASMAPGQVPVYMDSGGSVAGLTTIYCAGYSAPN